MFMFLQNLMCANKVENGANEKILLTDQSYVWNIQIWLIGKLLVLSYSGDQRIVMVGKEYIISENFVGL